MGSEYEEYAERQAQSPPIVQRWFATRVLRCVESATGMEFSDMRVLEVGTGLGYLAQAAQHLGVASYTGLEPNETLRALAAEAADPFPVVLGGLPDLPEALSGQYNVAILVHVLEHARDGIAARAWLDSLLGNLEPGGFVIIVSPDIVDYGGYFWDTDWTHGFPTSNRNVGQIFSDLGAQIRVSQRMRLGRIDPVSSSLGWWLSKIFPTRLANVLGRRLFGRDVGTGFQVAGLWSLTFVAAQPTPKR